jgi:hypothetical protein
VAAAHTHSEVIRRGLNSGVGKIAFAHEMAKKRELPNEEEVGPQLDEFTALRRK